MENKIRIKTTNAPTILIATTFVSPLVSVKSATLKTTPMTWLLASRIGKALQVKNFLFSKDPLKKTIMPLQYNAKSQFHE